MAEFQITGGTPLYGSVRLGGAKNASYKLMIAALLGEGETRLLNFSKIEDVQITTQIIEALGGGTRNAGERTIFIEGKTLDKHEIPSQFGPKSRAAGMFIPILLHKFGKAIVPLPGGDNIGTRPLGRHFEGLESMGAKIEVKNNAIVASSGKLKATNYRFQKNSHTGTETLIMAAVLAEGITVLENAAQEPEVDNLIDLFNNMGAQIRRRPGRIIEITGVKQLKPTIHKVMPDRNETISYAAAALITKGDIIVENARAGDLEAFLEKLDEIGAGYEIGNYGIRFYYKGKMTATDVQTQIHPGFMSDWQPLWTVVATQLKGESIIHETIFPNRFQHVLGLKKFGANIEFHPIKVDNPEKVYNFDLENDSNPEQHAILIKGPTTFKPPADMEVYDLRSGATMVLAALATQGQTNISKVELIDRGYESFDTRLCSMGANIKRID